MGDNITMEDVLRLTYYFSRAFKYNDAINEMQRLGRPTISRETVTDIYFYCREVCMVTIDRVINNSDPIGGVGKIVEMK